MIIVKNVKTLSGKKETHLIPSHIEHEIDGTGLTALPALMDPHVHFRVPGDDYKEDWMTAGFAAVFGGVSFVCDMPNNTPACITVEALQAKRKLIESQLKMVDIPLQFGLYLGATHETLSEISKAKGHACGLKIFMGGSTGNLLLDQDKDLDEAFKRASEANLLVAVHAEDEELLQLKKKEFAGAKDVASHSKQRDRKAAFLAVQKAIGLAEKYKTTLYILHVSTKEELELIREAKKRKLPVFAEATPHHLFLNIDAYQSLGTFAQMNPPLREKSDQEALWKAIADGTIDTIGTDHAPHTKEDKKIPFPNSPSGVPGIETMLPLLLNAVAEKRIDLKKLVELTHVNPRRLFGLPPSNDWVLVDLERKKVVKDEDLKTKCGWSPFSGMTLKGWPVYTIMGGRLFDLTQGKFQGKER